MGFFESYIEEARKKFGDDKLLVGKEEDQDLFGVELPSFSLQYLIHSNILPMSKIIGLAGPPASFKSAMGFEILKWHAQAGGYGHLIETENKLNPAFRDSVLGKEAARAVKTDTVDSVEQAQMLFSNALKYYRSKCPGKDIPFAVDVDSLGASAAAAMLDEIEKTGHASRTYPEAALLWTFYFKKISSDIIGLPFTVVFTNHLKEKMDSKVAFAEKPTTKQGGVAQDFHAMYYLYFTRVADINLASREGALISIKAHKCGTGPARRKIEVPVLWHFEEDPETGKTRQITTWDWHASTAKLMVSEQIVGRIRDVSDVTVQSNRYSSKRLGVASVSDTELGAALWADKAYMKELRQATGFPEWRVWSKPEVKQAKPEKAEKPAAAKKPKAEKQSEPANGADA
jgi:RecA/RadA recombinase